MSPTNRLGEHGWLDAYAAPTVTPGGGSASAVAAALGCALLAMTARIGTGRAEPATAERLDRLAGQADRLRAILVEQERTDGVYERMVATVRAARATEGDPGAARAAEAARADATEVPLATAELAADGVGLATELADKALTRTASDQLVAAHLLRAGLEGGLSTVAFNLRRMAAGPIRDDLAARADRLAEARRAAADLTDRLAAMVEQQEISPPAGDGRILPPEPRREE
jgi:methenyltetrahydrofolate cyclohydrolase